MRYASIVLILISRIAVADGAERKYYRYGRTGN